MPISIRDPRAEILAKDLARRRGTTMTEAIVTALQNELKRENGMRPLPDRLAEIARLLRTEAGPNGHDLSKDDIDALWGH